MSDDTFTPAPLISDQPVGSFVEDSLTPPAPSAFESSFEWARYLGPVGRSIGNASATYGDFGDWGERITEPEPPISKSEFDSKYSIPGRLGWDGPKPDSVYKSIYDTKLDELKRQDAAERRPAGIVAGAADLGVGLIADALDPLFLGSLIVPGAPEIELGEGLAARTGGRVLTGLASGAAQTAPLIGLKYAVARQEQADYTAGSALADLAMGAGLGAALHVGMGAFGDLMDRRMAGSRYRRIIEADPDARRAVFRTAAAQGLNDDPLELDPVFDAVKTAPGGGAPYPVDQPIQPYAPGPVPDHITDPVHPTQLTPGSSPLVPVPREPQRLVSYLIAAGGLKSDRGDVLQVMGGWRGRPGLLSPKNGRTIEDATLNAWQDGFFPNHSERPEPKDLIAAIEEDLKGNPQYSHYNEASLRAYQDAWATNNEVVRLAAEVGLPTTNITREQLLDAIHDHLTPEDFDARVGTEGQRAAGLYEEAERQAAFWVAHHGTPHTFDRFDTSKIGTGEGAQAFGHGLYFAENEGVANSYRRKLSGNQDVDFVLDGKEYHGDELGDINEPGAAEAIDRMIGTGFKPDMARGQLENDIRRAGSWLHDWDDETLREDLANHAFPESDEPFDKIKAKITPEMIAERRAKLERDAAEEKVRAQQALDWFDANKDRVTEPERAKGNLYTVNIKAEPHETLDWDKPLSEQPAEVKAAFRHAGFTEEEIERGGYTGQTAYQELAIRMAPERMSPEEGGWTSVAGGAGWTDKEEDARAASAVLHEGGLKGIRYADAGSRAPAVRITTLEGIIGERRAQIARARADIERNRGNEGLLPPYFEAREAEIREQEHWIRQNEAEIEALRKQGTHNIVVFNHDDVEITHRNGEPVEPHKPTEPELHELQAGQEPHGGFDAEHFYGADRGRSLEDLENDYRSETAARDARELAAGDEPGGSAAGDQGGVSGGTQPGGSGAGAAGRESAADRAARFAAALRRAAGERPVDPADAAANTAADAATKLNATERLAQAQKQVDQDAEFFQRVLGNQESAAQAGETTAVHRVFDTANDAWDVIHRAEIPDVTVAPNPEGGYWIVNRDGTPFATGVTTVQRSAVDQAFGDMVADEIRAELEALGDVDKDANAVGEGAAQAATCVIRGLAGGAT